MISNREKKIYYLFVAFVAVCMLAYVFICYGVMYWLRDHLNPAPVSYLRFGMIAMLSLVVEGWTRSDEWRSSPGRGGPGFRRNVTQRQWLVLCVSVGLMLSFSRDTLISRGYILFVLATSLPLLYALNRWGYGVFVGVLMRYEPQWRVRYSLVGRADWRSGIRDKMGSLADVMKQAGEFAVEDETSLEDLVGWVERQNIDLLVMPARELPDNWVVRLLSLGERRGFHCWIPLELTSRFGRKFSLQSIGGLEVLTPPSNPLGNTFNRMVKRGFDIVLAMMVILIILAPLMMVVWCVHRLHSPGPLFFRQDRLGENGKVFNIIKFRTMHVKNDCEVRQASCADPRIFKGGKMLRKLSVDEFPQFLNVLNGDMSVVGPRPHLEIHERQFENFYERYGMRRFVKPGVTGLAQVRGYRGEIRNPKDVRGRGRYDLIYVRKWSMALDFKIVLKTSLQVVRPHRNAY